jgi:hypothetical protein
MVMIIGNDCLPAYLPARAPSLLYLNYLSNIFDMEEVEGWMHQPVWRWRWGNSDRMMSTATALMMVIICDFVSG